MQAEHVVYSRFSGSAYLDTDGPLLIETQMGAIATTTGILVALAAARLLRVGRFAHLTAQRPRIHARLHQGPA